MLGRQNVLAPHGPRPGANKALLASNARRAFRNWPEVFGRVVLS